MFKKILITIALILTVPFIAKAETQFYKSDGFVDGFQTPSTAESFCENLDNGGYTDWRLANETDIADLPIGATNYTGYYIDALPRTNCEPVAETRGWFMDVSNVRYAYTINSQLEGNCPMMEEDARNVLCVRTVLTGGGTTGGEDTDLQNALASTTGFATDNKSQILTYIVGIIILVFVITIAKKAILWGFSKLAGVFGRGGRRRR